MSQTILERASRGIASLAQGNPSAPTAAQQRARGGAMIQNMGTGGLMLGGGTAAVVAALNLLNNLNKEKELEDESRLNDDTLYISDPKKPMGKAAAEAGVSPLLAPGLATTGAILGAGGAYALVQSVWNAAEKRRRQAMLDQAQQETIRAADAEVAKTAAQAPPAAAADPKFNLGDLLTATPVALPLLTMLATGGLTYAALNKSFPVVGKPKRNGPKRIRVMRDGQPTPYEVPPGEEEEESPDLAKAATHTDLEDAGYEFLATMVASSRKGTITGDLISKAARGGLEAMEELLKEAGVDALLASLKGASDHELPGDLRMLGTMALFKSATLSSTVTAIAASEYLENFGALYGETLGDHEHMSKLANLGRFMGIIARDCALPELAKAAALMPPPAQPPSSGGLLAAVQAMLASGQPGAAPQQGAAPGGSSQQREERDAALTSDLGGGVAGAAEDGSDGAPAAQESTGDDDMIDGIMATGQPEEVVMPSD